MLLVKNLCHYIMAFRLSLSKKGVFSLFQIFLTKQRLCVQPDVMNIYYKNSEKVQIIQIDLNLRGDSAIIIRHCAISSIG